MPARRLPHLGRLGLGGRPTRVRGASARRLGTVLATGAVLYAFDEPIYREIRRSRSDPFWKQVVGGGLVGGDVLDRLTGRSGVRHLFEELLISPPAP